MVWVSWWWRADEQFSSCLCFLGSITRFFSSWIEQRNAAPYRWSAPSLVAIREVPPLCYNAEMQYARIVTKRLTHSLSSPNLLNSRESLCPAHTPSTFDRRNIWGKGRKLAQSEALMLSQYLLSTFRSRLQLRVTNDLSQSSLDESHAPPPPGSANRSFPRV